MKFIAIKDLRKSYQVEFLCRMLSVSKSGFYQTLKREDSPRKQKSEILLTKVRSIHAASRSSYGSPKMYNELKKESFACSENKIAKLMKDNKIVSIRHKKFKITTTNSNHQFGVAENILNREFSATKPNMKWVGDITYIPTSAGFAYLATIIDLYSRKVVGWEVSKNIDSELVCAAFSMATFRRKVPADLVYHSDRGVQYASDEFQILLNNNNAIQSMSRKGNCWDNAVAESFFATLKLELVHHHKFQSVAEVKQIVADWIENFYNTSRSHSSINFMSPAEFEAKLA